MADQASPPPAPVIDEKRLEDQLRLLLTAISLEERLSQVVKSYEDKLEKKRPTPTLSPEDQRSLRWYLLGLGAVGATIGLFAGWSNSPVIATLLPILFGLVGAGGGYYLASQELRPTRARLLGKGLLVFVLPTIPAAVLGTSMRTDTGIFELRPKFFSRSEPSYLVSNGDHSADSTFRIAKLRASLVELGASTDERDHILSEAKRVLSNPTPARLNMSETVSGLTAFATALSDKNLDAVDALGQPVDASSLAIAVRGFADELVLWDQLSLRDVERSDLSNRLSEVRAVLDCDRLPKGVLEECTRLTTLLAQQRIRILLAYGSAAQKLMTLTDALAAKAPGSVRAASRGPASTPND